MKRFSGKGLGLRVVVLLALMLTSCGSTMRVAGNAPSLDNDGTCGAPVLLPNVSASVWIHVAWTGPQAGVDSLFIAKGAPFVFTRSVPAGTYSIRAWASDPGGAGCDTTFSRTFQAAPDRVTVAP